MARHVQRIARTDLDARTREMLEDSDAEVAETEAFAAEVETFDADIVAALGEVSSAERRASVASLYVDAEGRTRTRRAALRRVSGKP